VSPPPLPQHSVRSQNLPGVLDLLTEVPPPLPTPPLRQIPILLSQAFASPRPEPSARMYELELMNHYSTSTSLTFTAACVDYSAWQTFAVREAMTYEILMDGLLAFSALHIASKRPRDATTYTRIGLQYQTRALDGFRKELDHLTPGNCNAMFAFSIVSMMSAVASSRFVDHLQSPMESILTLFDFVDEFRLVLNTAKQWIVSGPFADLLRLWTSPGSFIHDQNTRTALNQLKAFYESTPKSTDANKRAIFANAIAQLETCFSRDREMVVIWLALAGREFMAELRQSEPMAMLIFLYWSVLLGRLRNEWWVEDCGRRLVRELSMRLKVYGPAWQSVTLWAERELGLRP
jgi:hypothetical protein